MEVLHITLKSQTDDVVELRYWKQVQREYEPRTLQVSEIKDLIALCEREYYDRLPQLWQRNQSRDIGELSERGGNAPQNRLQDIGRRLYTWLDGNGRWLTQAIANCAEVGIVLAIAPDQQLAHLPWEVLHDGQEFPSIKILSLDCSDSLGRQTDGEPSRSG